jgi:AcrR family transcriptional regulator
MDGRLMRGEMTTAALLDAALRTFAEHGYDRATVAMITARAGASRAAINYHFKSKDALFAATLDVAIHRVGGWILEQEWDLRNPLALARLIRSWTTTPTDEPDAGIDIAARKLLSREALAPSAGGSRDVLAGWINRIVERIVPDGAQPSGDDRARAVLIWSLWLATCQSPLPDQMVDPVASLLAAGA